MIGRSKTGSAAREGASQSRTGWRDVLRSWFLHHQLSAVDSLRRLLVSAAHYILGHYGPECDLRRYGERLSASGGKRGKKRAVVAVARKLAVLMHKLWVSGADYDPNYSQRAA